jgi:hypothetical protein
MEGETALLGKLLYGTGMRLMEGLRLRVKDVDFDRHVIIVREAKGNKDRAVMLPRSLAPRLRQQLGAARSVWSHDRAGTTKRGGDARMRWRSEIPGGGLHLGLVLGVSCAQVVGRSRCPGSSAGITCTRSGLQREIKLACGCGAAFTNRFRYTRYATVLRHALAAGGHRHPHRAGTAGPQRTCQHHDDLHPCAQGRSRRHGQPAGFIGLWRLTGGFAHDGPTALQGCFRPLTPAPRGQSEVSFPKSTP